MPETISKPRRRLLRFSVRGLLLLMLVISIPLGWKVNKLRQQRIAVAALEKMGLTVFYEGSPGPFYEESGGFQTIIKPLRTLLVEQTNVKQVSVVYPFPKPQITDAGLLHLTGLTHLKQLGLERLDVTDARMVYLQGLAQLMELDLSGTQLTDAGLVHLRCLTQLYWLNLKKHD